MDRNHAVIVHALRNYNCTVHDCSRMGGGFPDLLVWSPVYKKWMLLEIKDGAKPPSKRKLTPDQLYFHQRNHECYVVKTVEEALKVVGAPL